MKIKVIKQIIKDKDNSRYDIIRYKIKSVDKCCNNMINNPVIKLGDEYCQNHSCDWEYAVFIIESETDFDGWIDYTYYKIDYCPFCGEKIEIEIVNEIDVTDEYNRLNNERDNIHEQWKVCDSIKMKNKLEDIRHQLDVEINKLYENDGMDKVREYSQLNNLN